jgi:hypothetical protein
VRRTVPPSAEIEEQIDRLLAVGVGDNPRESLSELARLGARLIIQRAVEDEFDAWLGRARYERRPDYQRGLRNYDSGLRNGFRPRKVQTLEGELEVEIPQVREAAETFASRLFPRGTKLVRTEPLKALVIGAFVRGLSMRDVESLCEKAGLGKLSKSTASRICEELRERYEAFKRRDLYEVKLVALFLDATYLAVRPDGPKEGVLVAWGFTEAGERVLLSVMLGMRESYEDWQALARDLIARGLGAPLLIVADGAGACQGDRAVLARLGPPTLLRAPRAQPLRQAARARTRTRQAGLLAGARRRDQRAGRQAATPGAGRRARQGRLHRRRQMPRRRSGRARGAPALPTQAPTQMAVDQPARALPRRGQTADQGDGPLPRRDQLPVARLGRARSPHHPRDQRHPLQPARPPTPQADQVRRTPTSRPRGGERRID